MKKILAIIVLILSTSYAIAQTILLGNCGNDITGIQLSTGNIYCIRSSSINCSNQLGFTESCNSQYLGTF